MVVLEVIQGAEQGKRLSLERFPATIGRGPDCDLVLTDYHLSAEHLQIQWRDGQFVAVDLRSTNGTMLVRGNRRIVLQGPDSWEKVLEDGDRLLLGDPSSPVIIGCTIEQKGEQPAGRVVATRSREDVNELEGQLEESPSDLALLYRATTDIARAGLDLNAVLVVLADHVFSLLSGATHVTILLSDEDEARLTPVLARARDTNIGTVPFSRAVLNRVVEDRAAVLLANATTELDGSQSLMAANIMSSIGVPLWVGDRIRGVLQVDNRATSGIFQERDLNLVSVLASQAAVAVENARLYQKLASLASKAETEASYFKDRRKKISFSDIIGSSPAMKGLFNQLSKVMNTRATIHIYGETGTGKELVAQAVHYEGNRADKLFVATNCAALPENLLESELFGHVRGAFTGADREKKGLFEVADGGTLFLDEIGEMSPTLQARLLRVLQNGEVRPVGSSKTRKVDVRIISATNRDLEEEVKAGRFRQDLYYRINVIRLEVPPLRERLEDVPLLVKHFLGKLTAIHDKYVEGVDSEVMRVLMNYEYPGNVRELENIVERGFVLCPGPLIQRQHLPEHLRKHGGDQDGDESLDDCERRVIMNALKKNGFNRLAAARHLGMHKSTLFRKIKRLGLELPTADGRSTLRQDGE